MNSRQAAVKRVRPQRVPTTPKSTTTSSTSTSTPTTSSASKKLIEEITIVSSSSEDEDFTSRRPAKVAATRKTKNSRRKATPAPVVVVSKELEDKLLADDEDDVDGPLVAEPAPPTSRISRSRSPSLLGKTKAPDSADSSKSKEMGVGVTKTGTGDAGQLSPVPMEETPVIPETNQNQTEKLDSGYTKSQNSSPDVVLESHPEHIEEDAEPMISNSLESDMVFNEIEESEGSGSGEVKKTLDNILDKTEQKTICVTKSETTAEIGKNLLTISDDKKSQEKPEPEPKPSTSRGITATTSEMKTEMKERQSTKELKKFMQEVQKRVNLTPDQFKKIEAKMWTSFEEININASSAEFDKKVADKLHEFALSFENPKLKPFKTTHTVLEYLKSLKGGEKKTNAKEKMIKALERKLKKISKLIEKYDQQEVDWDAEETSPYLIKDRLVRMFAKDYGLLCKLHNSTTMTDRPIQKKIRLAGLIGYEEISSAVEKYINGRDTLCSPDFPEILQVAKAASEQNKLFLDDETIQKDAKILFQHIIKIVKRRRGQDLEETLPENPCIVEDPAETDPELARKLEENRGKGRKEEEVLKEFAERQEQLKQEAQEVGDDEDIENSPEASEDEDEEEEESSEEGAEIEISEDEDESSPKEVVEVESPESNENIADDDEEYDNGKDGDD